MFVLCIQFCINGIILCLFFCNFLRGHVLNICLLYRTGSFILTARWNYLYDNITLFMHSLVAGHFGRFQFFTPTAFQWTYVCVCVCVCVRVYVLTLGYLLREQLLGYRINTSSAQLVTASLLFNMVILVHISAGSV